jgi:2-oxoglutarate dehydrogenase E2 component (dihydrolipoamide succinyltransferase)
MSTNQATTKRRLSVTEKGANDIFNTLRAPFGITYFEVDMSRVLHLLSQTKKDTGRKLSFTALLVRATAMTLEHAPEYLDMLHGSRLIRPDTIDVSVSVVGRTRLAPLALVKDAVNKSLSECDQELAQEIKRIREAETKNTRLINRYGWLLPDFLRRIVLRLYLNSYHGTKKSVGSFQISNMSAFHSDFTITRPFSRPVMITGAVKKRPFVVDDRVEARPTCIFTVHVDHRLVDGIKGAPFVKVFSTLLEQHPEATLEKGSWVPPEGLSDVLIRIG